MEKTAVRIIDKQKPSILNSDTVVVLSLLVGIALGVVVSAGIPKENLVSICDMTNRLQLTLQGEWFRVFLPSFFGVSALMAVMYFCGFGAIFQPLSLVVCALRGIGLGVCVRGIYLCDNVFTSLAAFLPFSIASTAVLLAQAKQSIKMSGYYFSLTLTSENRLGVKKEVSDYTARFVILMIITAILCALDCLVARLIASAL